jgi:hypothetical protein
MVSQASIALSVDMSAFLARIFEWLPVAAVACESKVVMYYIRASFIEYPLVDDTIVSFRTYFHFEGLGEKCRLLGVDDGHIRGSGSSR